MTDVDYDAASATLRIRFADGDWYAYDGVPAEAHAALMAAPSKGAHFARHIRDAYRARRLTGPKHALAR